MKRSSNKNMKGKTKSTKKATPEAFSSGCAADNVVVIVVPEEEEDFSFMEDWSSRFRVGRQALVYVIIQAYRVIFF